MQDHEWMIAPFQNALKLKTGTIIEEDENGMLLQDTCGVWMLRQPNEIICRRWLEKLDPEEIGIIMVQGKKTMEIARELLGFFSVSRCSEVVWPYEKAPELAKEVNFRLAKKSDLEWILKRYEMLEKNELEEYIAHHLIWIAYKENEKIGFVGRHEEGSMGLLFVEKKFRNQGYAQIMEKFMIAQMLDQGLIPYADVFADNEASLSLQKKIGMKFLEEPVYWLELENE